MPLNKPAPGKDSAAALSPQAMDAYPRRRMRRLRSSPWLRELVQEHRLSVHDLIWPLFVTEGKNHSEAISSMPGVERRSIDKTIEALKEAHDHGVCTIALFPVTPVEKKTMDGAESHNPDNLVCRAVAEIKKALPDIGIICDVALDPYTTHGHDGIFENGKILNDETVDILCRQSLALAEAGADIIAPSDMMDGRIGMIRDALDAKNFTDTCILAYAAKYASAFYGPFREAVGSMAHLQGDKKTYQMNPGNSDEALREVAMDLAEGADMVMVKPGMPYLDIISRVKNEFRVPTFAYHVSGEYAMLRAACDAGYMNYENAVLETLLCFKRAGADAILTYAANDVAKLLKS